MSLPRIIGSILIQNNLAVQSIQFETWLPIGKPEISVQFLNQWDIDEILLLNIHRPKNKEAAFYKTIQKCSEKSFVPLTVGGGLQDINEVNQVFRHGADKVLINSAAHYSQHLIHTIAQTYGAQSIVLGIDVKKEGDQYLVYTHAGQKRTKLNLLRWMEQVSELNCGEICVQSINNDGTLQGLDLDVISLVKKNTITPVIAMGGVGHPKHLIPVFKESRADAVAIGNYLHYTEHSTKKLKAYLSQHDIQLREDTEYSYNEHKFGVEGRLKKRDAKQLESLKYIRYQSEEI